MRHEAIAWGDLLWGKVVRLMVAALGDMVVAWWFTMEGKSRERKRGASGFNFAAGREREACEGKESCL